MIGTGMVVAHLLASGERDWLDLVYALLAAGGFAGLATARLGRRLRLKGGTVRGHVAEGHSAQAGGAALVNRTARRRT